MTLDKLSRARNTMDKSFSFKINHPPFNLDFLSRTMECSSYTKSRPGNIGVASSTGNVVVDVFAWAVVVWCWSFFVCFLVCFLVCLVGVGCMLRCWYCSSCALAFSVSSPHTPTAMTVPCGWYAKVDTHAMWSSNKGLALIKVPVRAHQIRIVLSSPPVMYCSRIGSG